MNEMLRIQPLMQVLFTCELTPKGMDRGILPYGTLSNSLGGPNAAVGSRINI